MAVSFPEKGDKNHIPDIKNYWLYVQFSKRFQRKVNTGGDLLERLGPAQISM